MKFLLSCLLDVQMMVTLLRSFFALRSLFTVNKHFLVRYEDVMGFFQILKTRN
jgi:hypothetical protein